MRRPQRGLSISSPFDLSEGLSPSGAEHMLVRLEPFEPGLQHFFRPGTDEDLPLLAVVLCLVRVCRNVVNPHLCLPFQMAWLQGTHLPGRAPVKYANLTIAPSMGWALLRTALMCDTDTGRTFFDSRTPGVPFRSPFTANKEW